MLSQRDIIALESLNYFQEQEEQEKKAREEYAQLQTAVERSDNESLFSEENEN